MALERGDLIVFNNVESTDPVFGAIGLPFRFPVAYIPNVTYSTRIEDLVLSPTVRGSQIVVRDLGKTNVKSVDADSAADALDFNHTEAADTIRVIPLKNVIGVSEKIYEAVEQARASATGAKKVEVAFDDALQKSQQLISGYLSSSATPSDKDDELTPNNIIEVLIDEAAKLDYPATTLMVNKEVHSILQKTFTQGYYQANSREDVVRTGIVGTVLGYDVVIDHNADFDFVLYNYNHFPVANVFVYFGVVDARPTFVGSYAQAQFIQGGGGKFLDTVAIDTGAGVWGIKYKADITERTVTFHLNRGEDIGGTVVITSPESGDNIKVTVQNGKTVVMPADPVSSSHTFDGWFYDDGEFTFEFEGNRPIRKNMTLYAGWTFND